jgi:alpha-1,2-mannosyltransferase
MGTLRFGGSEANRTASADDDGTVDFGGPRHGLTRVRGRFIEILVLVVALAARLGVILREGGIHGIIGYDCGVYFAGADALIHGRLPYRDFTMAHPPGVTLILTPFAYLTHWMSDWHAFIIATLAFCLLGAVNAVLVVVVCRRLGSTSLGACAAGLFYAAWFGSVSGEFEVKLEPLGNFFLLCGLLLLLRAQRRRTWQANLVAGIGLGLTLDIKIWWIVPLLLLTVWHAWRQRAIRAGLQVLLGAAISVAVVYGPFFIADPSDMFRSVILDQLSRATPVSAAARISAMTTLPDLVKHMSHVAQLETAIPFVLVAGAVLILAWRASLTARALVALIIVQFGILMAAPSWIIYYCDYVAVGLALCIGAAASVAPGMRIPRMWLLPPLLLTAAVLVITSLITITGSSAIRPYVGATALTRDVRNIKCLMSDNPTVLLRLNALTRGLEAGCPNWIDVTGTALSVGNQTVPRSRNLPWQREYARYLRSGNAIIPWRPTISKASRAAIERDGVLARAGGHTIYRVLH